MKRKFLFSLALCCLLFSCSFSALATEEVVQGAAHDVEGMEDVPPSSSPVSSVEIPQPFSVEVTLVQPEAPEVTPSPEPSLVPDPVELVPSASADSASSVPVIRDVQALDPRPDNSVVSALTAVLGEYSPATYQTVTYVDGSPVVTTELVPGLAGLDWPWLVSAGIMALMLFCLFKLLGGLWK